MDISPTPSLFGAKRSRVYFQGNVRKFWRDEKWNVEKVAFWSTEAAISLNA